MQCLLKIDHINIIKLYEIINDLNTNKIYLIMDYLQGGTLQEKLNNSEKGLELSAVRKYFKTLLSALYHCHEVQNIAHRDIKPENILLDKFDNVKLCDFGVSEFFNSSQDDFVSGATKGTYLFMSPEMVDPSKKKNGIHAKACDIWACGVTLFNLLTKSHPFNGKNILELQYEL